MLDRFLSFDDSTRTFDLLRRLIRHRVESWVLTGGLAIEIHIVLAGLTPQRRALNDLDYIAARFVDIPETLAGPFLFRHVHPGEALGGIMFQFVDMGTKLRIDVFRAIGASMSRAGQVALPAGKIKIVAVEDLIARIARLSLDLADGVPIPAKHARDFLRLSKLKAPVDVQPAWHDHRKPGQPLVFEEVSDLLHELIPKRNDLLIFPENSTDVDAECPRCVPTPAFPLADPSVILSILGYC
jgi:hypothetical protein